MAEKRAAKRAYYRGTTASQRKLLFQMWEETGNVSEACRQAKVGRNTFYYWKSRFDTDGYGGLEQMRSHAPHNPHKTPSRVVARVLAMKGSHPTWGRRRIAGELRKENGWVWLVRTSTVGAILLEHGFSSSVVQDSVQRVEKSSSLCARHAERPGQAVNVDLCFVPAEHGEPVTIPAVSGSSGRLNVSPSRTAVSQRCCAGQVFDNPGLSYEEAMEQYIAARQEASSVSPSEPTGALAEQASIPAQKRAVKQQEEQLRLERRQVREARRFDDETWRSIRARRKVEQRPYQGLSRSERKAKKAERCAAEQRWRAQKEKRRQRKRQRKKEDLAWRAQRQEIREKKGGLKIGRGMVCDFSNRGELYPSGVRITAVCDRASCHCR